MKWHKGPPPSVGWWPASRVREEGVLRWWDGKHWSVQFYENPKHQRECAFQPKNAADASARAEDFPGYPIEWTDRPASWPARSKT